MLLMLVVSGDGRAQSCTDYSVNAPGTPVTANWTDTSGFWSPSNGSYPGRDTSCDTAVDNTTTATTIVVDSAIPNPISDLGLVCSVPGCVIDIQAGGHLTLINSAAIGSGSKLRVSGGTLTIASGALTFQSGAQFEFTGGSVDIQNGATMDFILGSNGVTSGGVLSGDGTLSISGGTLNIGGVTSPGTFALSAGTLDGVGFLSIQKYFFWDGGTMTGSGGAELAGTGQGTISGAGPMTLDTRTFNNYGTIGYPATTNLLHLNNGAAFNTYGTFNFEDDGDIIADGPSSVGVFPNGLMQKHAGSGVSTIYPSSTNDATVFVTHGAIEFAGNGTHGGSFVTDVDMGAGTTGKVIFSAPSTTINGAIYGAGNVSFPSGYTDYDGFFYSVGGMTSITGGTLALDGSVSTEDFAFDSGELDLFADFDMFGLGTWSGGTMAYDDGTFYVDSGATLTIDSANSVTKLDGAVMDNDGGTILYTAGSGGPGPVNARKKVRPLLSSGYYLELHDGSTIVNDGTFDIQTDTQIASTGGFVGLVRTGQVGRTRAVTMTPRGRAVTHRARTFGKHPVALCGCPNDFENFDTLKKSAGIGSTDFGPVLDNSGYVKAESGKLNFLDDFTQSSGSTTLGPGNIGVASPLDLEGGVLKGSGTIFGSLDNYGEVKPGTSSTTGVINITGDYTGGASGSGGTLTIKIAGPSAGQFDQLNVTGTATLDGTFNGSFINGYSPATGSTTWSVLTYASETGTFTTVNPPVYSGGTVTSAYNPTSFDLTAVTPATADLKILMNEPATVGAGAPLSYTIDVSNLGPDTASSVSVVDTLPAGTTFVSASGTGWSCNNVSGTVTCTLPSLAIGSAPTVTINLVAPIASGDITNSATVSSSVVDPVASNNTASVTTNVGPQASLSITKTNAGATPVNPGQTFSYTIVVTNAGPSPATGTVVSDPTPVGIAFVANSGGCTTPFPCNLGTLSAGQSVTITSTYSIPPSYSGGAISNTATVSAIENDPNVADNSATAVTPVGAAADVGISKTTSQSSVSLGQNITYTITVSNFGPSGATGVVVNDPTPAGTTFVSATGGGCSSFPCTIGTLAVGPPVTITAVFNVPANYAGTSVTNTATVSSASDPNSANDSSSVTTPISAQADLSITKTGPPSVTTGSNITYTITVTNSGQLSAANTFVSDPTPSGLTFVSNGGGCSGPFPCSLGTLATGQSVVITSTFNIPPGYVGATVTNTASVSTSSPESNTANNSSTATTPISATGLADLSITKSGPGEANPTNLVDFTLIITNNGPGTATNTVVNDPTPTGLTFVGNGGACGTPFPCLLGTMTPGKVLAITSRYQVSTQLGTVTNTATVSSSATDPTPSNNTASASMIVTPGIACPQPPQLSSPAPGATVSSPLTLTWRASSGAPSYIVTVNGAGSQTFSTSTTSVSLSLPNGSYSWNVQAIGPGGCTPAISANSTFTVCNAPIVPVPSVVGTLTTGQTYLVQWTPGEAPVSYELQEATEPSFSSPTSTTTGATSQSFTKNIQIPTVFYYRVRAIGGCTQSSSTFSATASIVVVPLPALSSTSPNVVVENGSTQPVTFPLHVNGLPNLTTSFIATADKPWLAVTPSSGIMPPEGVNFTISADPSSLQNGTWTGTVIIIFGTAGISGKQALDATPKTSIPVSISLATPVSPGTLAGPAATAIVIPSVGHIAGLSSDWQSDIRIANIAALSKKVQLTFSTGSATSQAVKTTTLSIDPGATTALDDIVRNWYGVGPMGDSTNGVLTVQALDAAGKPDLSVNKVTVVSSRTYNAAAVGTLGQFIPAVPLASFISKAPGANSILALQQIAQNDVYRTNLGMVEATGKPASVLVNVFNGAGSNILSLPFTLAGGEQRQLNSFLADKGVTLTNGHIEVQAVSGEGKVTAYASVVDSRSTDPLLVSGTPLGGAGATRFVLPGVASLDTGATWRSDVRVFNTSNAPQTATLTLYPTGNPSASVTKSVSIQPGEVKALDDIVHATFNLTNAGGALHVTTAVATPLVVTARTYDDTPGGTLGQFVQAVTPADAVGTGERSLQLLQMEDSSRYRTNLGLAEVTGKNAVVEVQVILPDSKVAPKVQIPLAAFEYRQFPIISSLGLGNTYNARISVKVIDGQGKITAYGSVIDQKTQDPTFVPAQ